MRKVLLFSIFVLFSVFVKAQSRAVPSLIISEGTGFNHNINSKSLANFWLEQKWIAGDFNGDGKDDLVNIYSHLGKTEAWLHLSESNGFAYQSRLQTFAGFWDKQKWLAGDFNGDGKDDLVNIYDNKGKADVWLHLSEGVGFAHQSKLQTFAGFSDQQKWLAGDFNGDGKDDLVNIYDNKGKADAWLHLSEGIGFVHQSRLQTFAGFWDRQKWITGDFNGDGKDDLVNVYGHEGKANAWLHLSDGAGFAFQSKLQVLANFWDEQKWLSGDFNGDGKDDLVNMYEHEGVATAWLHLSEGIGFAYQSRLQSFANYLSPWISQRWLPGDFNGDGKSDMVNVHGVWD